MVFRRLTRQNKTELSQQEIPTVIGEGCLIEGHVKAETFLRIDGTITGNVTISKGLVLGEKGVVNGDIQTKEMTVFGLVNGNVNTHTLEIKSTGKIKGEVNTCQLYLEFGAVYNGKVVMKEEKEAKAMLAEETEKSEVAMEE